nr:hypothetical protein [Tanacetum cinerariifolium]
MERRLSCMKHQSEEIFSLQMKEELIVYLMIPSLNNLLQWGKAKKNVRLMMDELFEMELELILLVES